MTGDSAISGIQYTPPKKKTAVKAKKKSKGIPQIPTPTTDTNKKKVKKNRDGHGGKTTTPKASKRDSG